MDRERRNFWYVDTGGGKIKRVLGYATDEPGCWWCPEVGYSLWAGAHIFVGREDAIARLREDLQKAVLHAQSLLEKMEVECKRKLTG